MFSRGQPLSWGCGWKQLPARTEPVQTTVKWKGTQQYLETVPRCFLSCEAETARDTHLRVASSLATVTTRRRLSYIRMRRTLWKLTGRSWTSPSRCRQELNPQIQEGMQKRRWNTHCRLRTNVKQPRETIVRNSKMFKETNYVKTNDQQWYGVMPDSCDARKTRTQCMSVSGHRIPMP